MKVLLMKGAHGNIEVRPAAAPAPATKAGPPEGGTSSRRDVVKSPEEAKSAPKSATAAIFKSAGGPGATPPLVGAGSVDSAATAATAPTLSTDDEPGPRPGGAPAEIAPPSPGGGEPSPVSSLGSGEAADGYFPEPEAGKADPPPVDRFANPSEAAAAAEAKQKRELAEGRMPAGVRHFTVKARDDRARAERRASAEARMSVASRHFRRLAEEREAGREAGDRSGGESGVVPAAIKRFSLRDRDRKRRSRREIQAMREQNEIEDVIRDTLHSDHFTNPSKAEAAAEAKERRELAEAQMPAGVKHFTVKARDDRARAERRASADAGMSVASRHFRRLAEEREAGKEAGDKSGSGGESGFVPAAIKHFSLRDRDRKRRSRREIQAMREQNEIAGVLGDTF